MAARQACRSLPVLTGRSAIYHLQEHLHPFHFILKSNRFAFGHTTLFTLTLQMTVAIPYIYRCVDIFIETKRPKPKGKKLKSLSLPQINKKFNKKPTKRPKVKPPKSKLTHSVALRLSLLRTRPSDF